MVRHIGSSNRRFKPRPIPEDMVSCPPALNTTAMSQKEQLKDRDFLSQLKLDLSDIEEGSERRSQSTSSKVSKDAASKDTTDRLGYTAPDPPSIGSLLKEKRRKDRETVKQDAEQREVNEAAKRGAMLAAKADDSSIVQRSNQKIKRKSEPPSKRPPTPVSRQTKARVKARGARFRQPSHISIYSEESGSVSTLRSAASSVAGSLYTTATIVVQRPAWGHKVVAAIIFLGWLIHHMHFQKSGFQPTLVRSRDIHISPMTTRKSVLKDPALYLTQDYDQRADFAPVKPVAGAFETISDEDYKLSGNKLTENPGNEQLLETTAGKNKEQFDTFGNKNTLGQMQEHHRLESGTSQLNSETAMLTQADQKMYTNLSGRAGIHQATNELDQTVTQGGDGVFQSTKEEKQSNNHEQMNVFGTARDTNREFENKAKLPSGEVLLGTSVRHEVNVIEGNFATTKNSEELSDKTTNLRGGDLLRMKSDGTTLYQKDQDMNSIGYDYSEGKVSNDSERTSSSRSDALLSVESKSLLDHNNEQEQNMARDEQVTKEISTFDGTGTDLLRVKREHQMEDGEQNQKSSEEIGMLDGRQPTTNISPKFDEATMQQSAELAPYENVRKIESTELKESNQKLNSMLSDRRSATNLSPISDGITSSAGLLQVKAKNGQQSEHQTSKMPSDSASMGEFSRIATENLLDFQTDEREAQYDKRGATLGHHNVDMTNDLQAGTQEQDQLAQQIGYRHKEETMTEQSDLQQVAEEVHFKSNQRESNMELGKHKLSENSNAPEMNDTDRVLETVRKLDKPDDFKLIQGDQTIRGSTTELEESQATQDMEASNFKTKTKDFNEMVDAEAETPTVISDGIRDFQDQVQRETNVREELGTLSALPEAQNNMVLPSVSIPQTASTEIMDYKSSPKRLTSELSSAENLLDERKTNGETEQLSTGEAQTTQEARLDEDTQGSASEQAGDTTKTMSVPENEQQIDEIIQQSEQMRPNTTPFPVSAETSISEKLGATEPVVEILQEEEQAKIDGVEKNEDATSPGESEIEEATAEEILTNNEDGPKSKARALMMEELMDEATRTDLSEAEPTDDNQAFMSQEEAEENQPRR